MVVNFDRVNSTYHPQSSYQDAPTSGFDYGTTAEPYPAVVSSSRLGPGKHIIAPPSSSSTITTGTTATAPSSTSSSPSSVARYRSGTATSRLDSSSPASSLLSSNGGGGGGAHQLQPQQLLHKYQCETASWARSVAVGVGVGSNGAGYGGASAMTNLLPPSYSTTQPALLAQRYQHQRHQESPAFLDPPSTNPTHTTQQGTFASVAGSHDDVLYPVNSSLSPRVSSSDSGHVGGPFSVEGVGTVDLQQQHSHVHPHPHYHPPGPYHCQDYPQPPILSHAPPHVHMPKQSDGPWPPNLPPRPLLLRLVHIFFKTQPLAPYLLHRPTFISSLSTACPLSSASPDSSVSGGRFPSIALLHAICAMGNMYSHPAWLSQVASGDENEMSPIMRMSDAGVGGGGVHPQGSIMTMFNSPNTDPGGRRRPSSSSVAATSSLNGLLPGLRGGEAGDEQEYSYSTLASFSEEQATFAYSLLEEDMKGSRRMLECVQTTIILAWYYHVNARWMEAWQCSESALRRCIPIGLHMDGFHGGMMLVDSWKNRAMVGQNNGPEYLEQRRAVFWIAFMLDSFQCIATSWPSGLNEADVSQTLPCTLADYEASKDVRHPRQHLHSATLFISNEPYITDSFTLHVKATILAGRAAKLNTRFQAQRDYLTEDSPEKVRTTAEFMLLERDIAAFQTGVPSGLNKFMMDTSGDVGHRSSDPYADIIDHNAYLAYIVSHVALIVLHDPRTDLSDLNDLSARTILSSANAILATIRALSATPLDFSTMFHGTSLYWTKAAAVVIRYLERELRMGNIKAAAVHEADIATIKGALRRMGKGCPVARAHGTMIAEWTEAAIANGNNATPEIDKVWPHVRFSEGKRVGIGPAYLGSRYTD
ncbi:uncharacterized protein EI90DRAFT_3030881 [Cantharellus anzutake]|uniref:uncharacterized protein n=1 Tax=Cantharellus anzutake TaxID=1750568 RepID=UPI001904DE21|nr:uncharacterized protein EI90DRAFT_3030881 [Cantharellus anzutake]KAF8342967.1 hypothetical protein EI90DRAFT_3030881 [Cantharellus anzutake]